MLAWLGHDAASAAADRFANSLISFDLKPWHEFGNALTAGARVRWRRELIVNVLGTLVTIVAVVIGAVILIPILGVVLGLAASLGGVLIWLLPIVLIAASDKVGTAEKILWILAIIFLSWFAWIFYFFFAPVFDRPQRHSYY